MLEPKSQLKSYAFDPHSAVESRVGPAPAFLLEALKKMDGKSDYEAYMPSAEEAALIAGWLGALPAKMREAFTERLIGMYFVKNFTGNGMTNLVLDDAGRTYAVIVFNPVGFGRTLSQTLTLRDATVFKGDSRAVVDCGAGDRGMLYTILHEGTHAYDFIRGVTPYVEEAQVYVTRGGKGLDASWDVWANIEKPLPEADYPDRPKVHFYGLGGGPKLTAEDARETYAELQTTPFVSLYGSQSWAEDVADLFTFYHLTRAMKRTCEIRVAGPKPLAFQPMGAGTKARARAERLFGNLY